MNSRDLNRDDWDLPWDNDNGTVAPPKKKQLDHSGFAFLLGLLDWRLDIWLGNVMEIKQTMAMNIGTINFSKLEDWIVRPFGDTSRKQHTHSSNGLSVRSWSNLSRAVIFDLLHAKGISFCSFFSLHDTFTEWKFSESFLSVATITRIHQFCHGSRKPLQADPFKTETKRANQFLNWRRKSFHVVADPSSLLRRTHVDSMLLNLSRVGTTAQWVHS